MKIAVTSKGTDLGSEVDPRFGRAEYILIVDSKTFEFEVFDNIENVSAIEGASIKATAMINDKDAEVLMTGHCGPNAFEALKDANIKVVNGISSTVREAVIEFNEGKMLFADKANTKGTW